MSGKPTAKRSAKKRIKKKADPINSDIIAISIMAFAILLCLCIYTKFGVGSIGGFFKSIFVGFFGVGGFIIPIYMLTVGAYIFFAKQLPKSKIILNSSITLLLFITLAHIVSGNNYSLATNSSNFFTKAYTSANGFNGGFFGAFFGDFFIGIIGKIGTIVILVFALIFFGFVLSGKSFIDLISSLNDLGNSDVEQKYLKEKTIAKPKNVYKGEPIRPIRKKIVENDISDYEYRSEQLKDIEMINPRKADVINVRKGKSKNKKRNINLIDIDKFEIPKSKTISYTPIKIEEEMQEAREMEEQENYQNIIEEEVEMADKIDYKKNKDLVEALKEELRRQSYLFQETQNELIEQKKVEKSLLRIINAQRETIEKLTNDLENEVLKNRTTVITSDEEIIIIPTDSDIVKIQENLEAELVEAEQSIVEPLTTFSADTNIEYSQIENKNIDDFISDNNEILEPIDIPEEIINDTEGINEVELTQVAEIANEVENFQENDIEEELDIAIKMATGLPDIDDEDLINLKKASEKSFNISESSTTYENQDIINRQNSILEQKSMGLSQKDIANEFEEKEKYIYKYPTVDFLNAKPKTDGVLHSKTELLENSKKLEATLKSFGVVAKVIEVNKGPTVTRYEVQPGLGVKVSKIANLADDLALNLAAKGIRIQAPIPGKAAVGIEVPNEKTESVYLREVLDDPNFKNFPSKVAFGIGKDIAGNIVVADLAKMPHLLIAGATGSGKSVCINTIITSIIYKSSPEEVKLLMIDPKVVELSVYNGIPHLLIPVVTDPKKASSALHWAVREMEKRYKLFADNNVRDLKGYNKNLIDNNIEGLEPQIVIIIDELADLMMTAAKEVEDAIMRLAAMARAAGIHIIIATQRPSVDVITGVIKSNIPSRLAFAVSSGIDSKTILDSVGAEKLLGKGDMLFSPAGSSEPMRIQGAFISDKEVESIVNFLKTDIDHEYMKEIIEDITSSGGGKDIGANDKVDEILEDVVEFIIDRQKASTSLIQRQFRVGFNRAARIVEELENFGVIGQEEGNKPRKVLMTMEEWDNKFRV